MIESVILIVCGVYTIYFLLLLIGWMRIKEHQSVSDGDDLSFSVIIPVRNEGKHIYHLLSDLSRQNYNPKHFEVIVVDDASEDHTVEEVSKAMKDFAINIRLIKGAENKSFKGKKEAITTGVSLAKYDRIIATDGDCRLGANWIDQYRLVYVNTKARMVLGPVAFQNTENWFETMQKVEFSALIGLGAASLQLGMPNICNGANLSYEKDLFVELDGYKGNEKVPSGDDEFLLQKAYNAYPDKISFNKSFEALSYTEAKGTLAEFLNQRIRWSAKWKYHKSTRMKLWGLWMFIFNLAFVVFSILLFYTDHKELFLSILFVKLIVEYVYIYKVNSDLRNENSFLPVIILQLIYPFYIIFLMISSFLKRYRWKGRLYL